MLLPRRPATEAGWALLRDGGHVVLIRHAMSPGATDPANFDIDNCSTQRNLSERGQQQARQDRRAVCGARAPTERVLSSRYCRCLDTRGYRLRRPKPEIFAPLDPLPADPQLRQGAARRDHGRDRKPIPAPAISSWSPTRKTSRR